MNNTKTNLENSHVGIPLHGEEEELLTNLMRLFIYKK